MRPPCTAWARSGWRPIRSERSRQKHTSRCATAPAISTEFGAGSKQALLHVDDVLVLHIIIQVDALLLHLARGVAPMPDDAALGALARNAASGRKRLHDRHAALERILTRLLHLTVDVEQWGL